MADPRPVVPPIASDEAAQAPSTASTDIGLLPGPTDPQGQLLDRLVERSWSVAAASDRMGLRLDGEPLPDGPASVLASHGVTWGTVQVPPDGRPIVLLADHQPTGGYPVAGVVPMADHPRLAQLRPGDPIHFRRVTLDDALAALRRQRDALDALERACRDDLAWAGAWLAAGG
jgi:antagonist of KipI